MSTPDPPAPAPFTPAERDYIRRELDIFFSTLPSVAEGFYIKTWRGGPQAGQPKVPQAAAGLVERGLLRLDTTGRMPRLFFTDKGLTALRTMMAAGVLLIRLSSRTSARNSASTQPRSMPRSRDAVAPVGGEQPLLQRVGSHRPVDAVSGRF